MINHYIVNKDNCFQMITLSDLEKYDLKGIHRIYDTWPQIARDSYESTFESIPFTGINHIVFAGMGGSGTIGDVFSSLLSKTNIHVSIVKGYLLPKTVDSQTLVICTSVSGDTVETLNILELASKMKCKLIVFSSGGKMEELTHANNIFYKKIPLIHSPRASFINYFYTILGIIQPIIPISKNEIDESITALYNLSLNINSNNLSEKNSSLELSEWINFTPIIYYPSGLQAAAIRFKNSLQENSKTHAMIEDVIEACHNNIVSWERSRNFSPILLQGHDDYIKTKERWNIVKDYFLQNHLHFKEINSPTGSILTKLVCLIYLLDYTTIYLAIKNKIDPTPVRSIDFIKKQLQLK